MNIAMSSINIFSSLLQTMLIARSLVCVSLNILNCDLFGTLGSWHGLGSHYNMKTLCDRDQFMTRFDSLH